MKYIYLIRYHYKMYLLIGGNQLYDTCQFCTASAVLLAHTFKTKCSVCDFKQNKWSSKELQRLSTPQRQTETGYNNIFCRSFIFQEFLCNYMEYSIFNHSPINLSLNSTVFEGQFTSFVNYSVSATIRIHFSTWICSLRVTCDVSEMEQIISCWQHETLFSSNAAWAWCIPMAKCNVKGPYGEQAAHELEMKNRCFCTG